MIPSDHWYKNAIIYTLDVAKFQDSNADGIGDFPGLTRRLEYLSGLGATCVWLLPFYPSPMRDNGYDVTDYYGVDPRYGTLGDFVDFVREAHERGIRVMVDLVANHTSNEHPWFRSARSDPKSPYRDWYVWKKEPPQDEVREPAFPGEQDNVWTYDEQAGMYYLHHFYDFQPDLNINNPKVRDEIKRVMGFWTQIGVSGFRVDAAPYLIEDTTERRERGGGQEAPYEYLREFREFLDRRRGDAVLLAEVNVSLDRMPKYYADANRFHMLFNFHLNQNLFLAMAREKAEPLQEALHELPEVPWPCQLANFIRNHDELTLDRLSDDERREVFEAFGPEEHMRIYGRGIRRRLPPMVDGDRRRILLACSLLFTLPGTPVLRYGEEIGMGDDLSLKGRDAVRTVMQWDDEANGGFSTAPPEKLVMPTIREGPFGYENGVNVEEQERDQESLFSHIEMMIRTRKRCPELSFGECKVIHGDAPGVFIQLACGEYDSTLAVHNLTGQPADVHLDLTEIGAQRLRDLMGDETYEPIRDTTYRIKLNAYGYRWFRIAQTSVRS